MSSQEILELVEQLDRKLEDSEQFGKLCDQIVELLKRSVEDSDDKADSKCHAFLRPILVSFPALLIPSVLFKMLTEKPSTGLSSQNTSEWSRGYHHHPHSQIGCFCVIQEEHLQHLHTRRCPSALQCYM